jgi:type I restriction enzyme R subunit
MLTPEMVLDILRTYTLFTQVAIGSQTTKVKIIPRYPQVEAVEAIVDRAEDPKRDRGLIWHHQGSGKTFLMAFAAVKLIQDPALDAPTVLVVLDRLDLIEQTTREFKSAGVPRIREADTKEELRRLLAEDARGVIMTTIYRFDDASLLNDRSNIFVLVDEAHRTQEGMLGAYMRAALPNAKFFGLTGSPISTVDKNTFALFGDPSDPGRVMNTYSIERSIADGATLPVHVETRLVDFHLDKSGLDEAFAEMAEEERLSDVEREILIRKAGRVEAFLKNPKRVRAICEDIVDHWFRKLAPLGLKAQIVAFDRELCVEYLDILNQVLDDWHRKNPGEPRPEATIVMTVGTTKSEPAAWKAYELSREEEAKVKARFRDVNDPLSFLIVTSKLLTGFDAPIEGVMYLDKPLRAHTLFQAITRTNRRWTNPNTGQEKQYGLVVDYVGVGREIVKSLQSGDPNRPGNRPVDITELHDELEGAIKEALEQFQGIDRQEGGFETLLEAQKRVLTEDARATFVTRFLRCETIWEFLWPDIQLRQYKDDYQWLAKVYASIQPADPSAALLWHRLGAKTLRLVHDAIGDVRIDKTGLEEVVVDEGMIEVLRQLGLPMDDSKAAPTVDEALGSIEARLRAKLSGPKPHSVWGQLSERLEALRRSRLQQATESVEFLKKLLELAKEVVEAEKAEREGTLDQFESILPDPQKGALTQIFLEFKPDTTPQIIERVVTDIDTIVREVRFTGWQASSPADREVRQQVRKTLQKYGLPPAGPLFDRAYAYIRENY